MNCWELLLMTVHPLASYRDLTNQSVKGR